VIPSQRDLQQDPRTIFTEMVAYYERHGRLQQAAKYRRFLAVLDASPGTPTQDQVINIRTGLRVSKDAARVAQRRQSPR
jgi:hypothetical protein